MSFTLIYVFTQMGLPTKWSTGSLQALAYRFGHPLWYAIYNVWFCNTQYVLLKAQGKDGVTFDQPPNSAHFDISQQIKRQSATPAIPNLQLLPLQQLQHAQPWDYNYAGGPPLMYAQLPHQNYGTHQMMYVSHGYGGLNPLYNQPPPFYNMFAPPLLNNSVIPSPGDALHLKVPLEVLCDCYNVSALDQEKLAALEYKPGNKVVERLTREDWAVVKFSALG